MPSRNKSDSTNKLSGLIADIGGTNARFALCDAKGEVSSPLVLACADYAGPDEAAEAYLERVNPKKRPIAGAFAVASPVLGDMIEMTNHVWCFSTEKVKQKLGFEKLMVLNDFVAQAMAVPFLAEKDRVKVGGGEEVDGGPIAVIGPGTGLGVSILVHTGHGWKAVPTEGGHVTMPPANNYESAILDVLRRKNEHISAERVISGSGLVNLYKAIAAMKDKTVPDIKEAAQISALAIEGDADCLEAVEVMFSMLGTIAGNLGLVAGATGGVFIAGGIVPRAGMLEIFKKSRFRERFEAKGRFKGYMSRIPTWVVTHDYPAFMGLSAILRNE